MAKSKLTLIDLAPATDIERARAWAESVITPEIRSTGIEVADAQSMMLSKVVRFADLLHSKGVLSCHVHLGQEAKKTATGDVLSKWQAMKEQLDVIFDASLTPTKRALIDSTPSAKRTWDNSKSKLRPRIAEEMASLEKTEALLNGEEVEGEGESKSKFKSEHELILAGLQTLVKRLGKLEPSAVNYDTHKYHKMMELALGDITTKGEKSKA